jgi:hypothetical protein
MIVVSPTLTLALIPAKVGSKKAAQLQRKASQEFFQILVWGSR